MYSIILPLTVTPTYTQLTEARCEQDGDARVLNLRQHALANANSVTPVGACLIERCLGGEMPVTQEAACLQIERDMLASCCKMPILFEGLAEGYIIGADSGPKKIADLSARESHHAQLVAAGYLASLSASSKRENRSASAIPLEARRCPIFAWRCIARALRQSRSKRGVIVCPGAA
jgi:hypothetical protein